MNLTDTLSHALVQSKIDLDEPKQHALIDYLHLIHKWNKVHNLTAIRDEQAMLTLHILDSLAVLPFVDSVKTILDVGSGAGLPGIVIAICRPNVEVTVIDASQKKASFMRQVKAELNINNLTVLSGRVEALKDRQYFDVIISRAFSSLENFISLTKNLIKPMGRWLAMKGQIPEQEMLALKNSMNLEVQHIDKLDIPGLQAERHLLTFVNQTTLIESES